MLIAPITYKLSKFFDVLKTQYYNLAKYIGNC